MEQETQRNLGITRELFYQFEGGLQQIEIPIGRYTSVNELMPSGNPLSRLETKAEKAGAE